MLGGAGNGTSAYLLRKSAPAAVAYRRPCLLAINASRLFNARTLSGSSPGTLLKKARHRNGVVLVLFTGAGNGTSARPRRGRAPASGALRRLRLLATNASRLFYARTLSGSSPGALLKKARQRDAAVLVLFTGAGNGTRTRECQLGKLMPYHLAMPACVLASITRLSCSIQGYRCLF